MESGIDTDSESLLRRAAEALRSAGVDSPRREARLLLAHAVGVASERFAAGRQDITSEQARRFENLLQRRAQREPLAYIIGHREFWSMDFAVAPGVLIPRPETETLVEAALKIFADADAPLRVLDLGAGTGCLLLAFLSERCNASGIGIDVSACALALAARNARALSLHERAEFRAGDWTKGVAERFDVIFANPPYIAAGELAAVAPELTFEPRQALCGGMDGLGAFREIAAGLPSVMAFGAAAFLEIGHGQANAVEQLFSASKLKRGGTICDLAGIPRCVIVRADAEGQA